MDEINAEIAMHRREKHLKAFWLLTALLAMAPVNIMCALLYCEARDMDAAPPATGAPGSRDGLSSDQP
jgi:hypothetical protein